MTRWAVATAVFLVVLAACSDRGDEANTATGDDRTARGSQGGEIPPALGCDVVTPEVASQLLGGETVTMSFDDPTRGCGYDAPGTDVDPDLHFLAHREETVAEAAAQVARHIDFEVSVFLVAPEDLPGVRADEAVHVPGAEGDLVLARRGDSWVEVRAPGDGRVISGLLDVLTGS